MSSPRYFEMLNNSGGNEWWNSAADVQRGRIDNFNLIQDAPLYMSDDSTLNYTDNLVV